MKGIILHGGHGTRLRPLTHTGPKQLLPIANKPMSEYCLNSLKNANITEIAIIIGGIGSEKVKEHYGNGEQFDVKITYVEQDQPLGIAHAIGLCKSFVNNEKFIVFLGDNILNKDLNEYSQKFQNSDTDAMILLCEVDNPSRFGIADLKENKIIKIIEKPKNPPTNLAVTGIYFLTPIIFEIINKLKPSWRNELEITDALQILLEKRHKITYDIVTEYWKDTGTPEDIIHANRVILENMKSYFHGEIGKDVSFKGNIMVGEKSIIKSGVVIEGPVIIGKNCYIETGVRIGSNASIGDNSIIMKGDIENSIIMADCEIDCNIKIRNSIIASHSKIGTQKLDDGKILLLGEGSKISL